MEDDVAPMARAKGFENPREEPVGGFGQARSIRQTVRYREASCRFATRTTCDPVVRATESVRRSDIGTGLSWLLIAVARFKNRKRLPCGASVMNRASTEDRS